MTWNTDFIEASGFYLKPSSMNEYIMKMKKMYCDSVKRKYI